MRTPTTVRTGCDTEWDGPGGARHPAATTGHRLSPTVTESHQPAGSDERPHGGLDALDGFRVSTIDVR